MKPWNYIDRYQKNLTDEQVFQLIKDLQSSNQVIDKLSLAWNKITDKAAPALLSLKNVRALDLTANSIGSQGIIEIPEDSLLSDLSLKSTDIGAPALIKLLKCKHLKSLSVDDNQISGEELTQLDIPFNASLESLSIGANPLGDKAVVRLAEKLPGLKRLAIYDCNITDSAITGILSLCKLEYLMLAKNPITDNCMKAISQNNSLNKIDIDRTPITDRGVELLFNNSRLQFVYIGFSQYISEQMISRLSSHLKRNRQLARSSDLDRLGRRIERLQIDNNSMDIEEYNSPSPRPR